MILILLCNGCETINIPFAFLFIYLYLIFMLKITFGEEVGK